MKVTSLIRIPAAAFAVAILSMSSTAYSQSSWDGGDGANGSWAAANNWVGNVAPTFNNTTDLLFSNTTRATANAYFGGTSRLVRSITFGDVIDGTWTTETSTGSILTFSSNTGTASLTVDAGADALALINTVLGMVINLDSMRPHLGGKTGGLSGPAIRPVAVRAIYQVHAALPNVPILGMGGVASGRDALELILAGASGVSVGTASFGNPTAVIQIQRELQELLVAKGFPSLKSAVGYAHRAEEQ
jgi:hypothetical protein